jgi:uncharacterized membrane protein YeaQ/YmgE (transglycosylase-associated protein family)
VSRDPFLRVALIALCIIGVLGLVLAAERFGWRDALIAGVLGSLLAAVVAEDWSTPPLRREPTGTVQRDRMRTVLVDGEPHEVRRFDRP